VKRRVRPALILTAAVAAGSFHTTSALACDRSPDLMRIPGSTDEEAEARYTSYERDRDIIAKVELEKRAIESHWTVYLAKVEKIVPSTTEGDPNTVFLMPVWPVRGVLPTKSAALKENKQRFCEWPPGGLLGSKVGDLVVVFGEYGSAEAWFASEVRSGELIDAIDLYAYSLEKKSQ
jgi:hypothetical protein